MWNNIFKRKKFELRCYSLEPQLPQVWPVELSKQNHPEWFKKLDPYVSGSNGQEMPTSKMCPGIKYFFDSGIIIPLWCDFEINRMETGMITTVFTPRQKHSHETHPEIQYTGAFPNWMHIKLLNPWFFDADSPVQFLATMPTWHHKNPNQYIVAPGMLEFKYQHAAHVQMFLPPNPPNTASKLILDAGTPMLQLIPTEKIDLNLVFCEITPSVQSKIIDKYNWTWKNLYRKNRKQRENTECKHLIQKI